MFRTFVHPLICALLSLSAVWGQSRAELRSHILFAPAFPEIIDTLQARGVPVSIDDFQTIIMNAGDAESSGGVPSQMVGDDGKSFGYWQNKITVYLPRHFPNGWTELDSIAAVMRLVTDHYLNQDEYLQTFLEMLRVHSQRGRTRGALLRATLRSTNRGKRRVAYMDDAGDEYLRKCSIGVTIR